MEAAFDWGAESRSRCRVLDETLRDGLQSPSVRDPTIDDKLAIVECLARLGVDVVNVGLPGAGPRAATDATALARHLASRRLPIRAACAARTHIADVTAVIEVSQRAGIALEVMAFIGSSPVRLYAEGWDVDHLLRRSREAISLAVRHGLAVTFVTEDTTRSRPETLAALFANAIDHGAARLCLCDTVGHATPDGIAALVRWTRALLARLGVSALVGLDWHGHNDRGLAVGNTVTAIEHGVDRAHATIGGIGERVGNAALEHTLENLHLRGLRDAPDPAVLRELRQLASRFLPPSHPASA